MSVTTDEATVINAQRKKMREDAASTQEELDQLASELYAEVGSWAKVAARLGYANGAVARRAALRHVGRTQVAN